MSRSLGRVQQAILALIASDEHGAWVVADICDHVYTGLNRIEKKHRVAVNRALTNMTLPEPWEVQYSWSRGAMRVLCNTCAPEIVARADWLTTHSRSAWCNWKRYQEKQLSWRRESVLDKRIAERRRYYAADELGRVEHMISEKTQQAAALAALGAKVDYSEELESLERRRAELTV